MEHSNKDFIQLVYKIDPATPGEDLDAYNPFSRALQNLMGSGKPHRNHAICLALQKGKHIGQEELPRWLGVFVVSHGNRIIFFPGLEDTATAISTTHGGKHTSEKQSFFLDHLSLETSGRRWHFTSIEEPSKHISGGRVSVVGENQLLWLGMSFSSFNKMRLVRSQTIAGFSAPTLDSERRLTEITKLQDKAHQHQLTIPDPQGRFEESFVHFAFIFGPKSSPLYRGPDFLQPQGSPSLIDKIPPVIDDFEFNVSRISLTETEEMQIASMILPGRLVSAFTFTTPNKILKTL